jgi:hypothetical protein
MAVQAIHVAAKFALADLGAAGPKSIKEMAEATPPVLSWADRNDNLR